MPGAGEHGIDVEPGIRLHVSISGAGPRTLIVPGAAWLERPLAPLAARRRLVSYDTRGRGRSSSVEDRSRLGVDFDVADLAAVHRHLGSAPAAILAHSHATATALLYALEHPGAVERLVLVGPYGPRRDPWHLDDLPSLGEMIRPPGAPRLGALRAGRVHRTDPRSYAREWMREYYLPLQVARPDHVDLVPLEACDLPNEFPERWAADFLERILPSLGDWDWRPLLPSLSIPVLLVWGEGERPAPAMVQEWIGGLPHAQVLVVPGSGHLPFHENPGAFFPAVDAFLEGAHHGLRRRA
ncbi:MAG TPA: alpha/beta hydrolase [Anaeromyxobacteraceae bacterium]|nr:alpha/beta hydrolase [Anaeromyxobacteraceae bacterium]